MVHMVASELLRPHSILSMEKVVNEGMAEERSGGEASAQENWKPDSDAQIFNFERSFEARLIRRTKFGRNAYNNSATDRS